MLNKIYVDGCSYFYGQGIDREYALAKLLEATTDNSCPAKSNIAIAHDFYKSLTDDNYDYYVIGYTWPARTTFYYANKPVHFFPNSNEFNLTSGTNQDFTNLHKLYYAYSDLIALDTISDCLIDSTIALLEKHNKKFVVASWNKRKHLLDNKVLYPRDFISKEHCLNPPHDWHLTVDGMKLLAERIKKRLYE